MYNGNYYDEIISKDYNKKLKKPFLKSFFKEYLINIDLASLNDVDFNSKENVNKHSMMKINDLIPTIDSLNEKAEDLISISSKMYNRSNFKTISYNLNPKNGNLTMRMKTFKSFPTKKQKQLYDLAISSVKSSISIIKSNKTIQFHREKKSK